MVSGYECLLKTTGDDVSNVYASACCSRPASHRGCRNATLGSMSSKVFIGCPQSALFEVFESNRIEEGMTHDAPGGARLELGRMPMEKRHVPGFEAPATVLVTFGATVAMNLFSAWLYDRLKSGRVTRIRINRTEVEVTPEAITRVIIESIDIEQK